MRLGFAIFGALALLAGVAQAGVMDTAYGNTVQIIDANGASSSWYFDADGKVAAKLPDGSQHGGTWTLEGANLCTKLDIDSAAACRPAFKDGIAVGQTVNGVDQNGKAISISVIQGR